MKFTKAALRNRHVQLGHLTVMQPTQLTEVGQPPGKPRTYSTERFTRENNGISIPHQLRERIEASVPKREPEVRPRPFISGGWGFL